MTKTPFPKLKKGEVYVGGLVALLSVQQESPERRLLRRIRDELWPASHEEWTEKTSRLCDLIDALLAQPEGQNNAAGQEARLPQTTDSARKVGESAFLSDGTQTAPAHAAPSEKPQQSATPHRKLWLWKNFVNGRPEYWAFDNPYPTHANGDPMTVGEPCGYALLKDSTQGRFDVSEEQVIAAIKRAHRKRGGEMSDPRGESPSSVIAAINKALLHVSDLCTGKTRWRMCVPVNEAEDSDCIIADALMGAKEALLSATAPNARAVAEKCAEICEKPRIWDAARGMVSVVAQCREAADEIRAYAASLPAEAEQSEDVVQCLLKELDAKQAELDRVMFEHCPDEMTQEQIENWKRHQVVEPTGNAEEK